MLCDDEQLCTPVRRTEQIRERESVVREFNKEGMTTRLFKIPILLDGIHCVKALFNGGSAPFYGLIDESTARRLNLPRIPLKRKVGTYLIWRWPPMP